MAAAPDDDNLAAILDAIKQRFQKEELWPPLPTMSEAKLRTIIDDLFERKMIEMEARIKRCVQQEIRLTMELVGLPIDDDHRIETREQIALAIRSAMTIQKISTHGLITIVGTICASIGTAAMVVFGLAKTGHTP